MTPPRPSQDAPRVGAALMLSSVAGLARSPYQFWVDQYRRHGPVYQIRLPDGRGDLVVLAGGEANRLLHEEGRRLFSTAATYPRAPILIKTNAHPSFRDDAVGLELRAALAKGFQRKAIAPQVPAILAWMRAEADALEAGQAFNVASETSRMGLEAVSFFSTGRPLQMSPERLRSYAAVFTGVIALGWPMAGWKNPWMQGISEEFRAMVRDELDRHRHHPPGPTRPPDYFDHLMQMKLGGVALPDAVWEEFGRLPFKNMAVYAGRVINHVLYDLVSQPEMLDFVRDEVDVLGRTPASEADMTVLDAMPRLRACIMESLRIRPVAVALQRTVEEEFTFEGFYFSKGDELMIPIGAPHLMEEYFPEPERYDPTRFLGDRAEHRQGSVYAPFGVGHHSCVARGLFEAITQMVVGTLLHQWTLRADYDLITWVDVLPGPLPLHRMDVVERRVPASA